MKISLGEKEYDLAAALPLTIGDLRKMKKEQNVDLKDLGSMEVDTVAKVLLHIFRKVDATVTMEQVDQLSVSNLQDIAKLLNSATVPDRPISG